MSREVSEMSDIEQRLRDLAQKATLGAGLQSVVGTDAAIRFVESASPDTILALLAEIERLRAELVKETR